MLIAERMPWKIWLKENPNTLLLSDNTGYQRDYSIDPYEGYYRIGSLMFPVGDVRRDLSAKEPVLGVEIDNHAKAYPMDWLRKNPGVHKDLVGNHSIRIEISSQGDTITVKDANGQPIPVIYAYWFAWQAFHQDTQVFGK